MAQYLTVQKLQSLENQGGSIQWHENKVHCKQSFERPCELSSKCVLDQQVDERHTLEKLISKNGWKKNVQFMHNPFDVIETYCSRGKTDTDKNREVPTNYNPCRASCQTNSTKDLIKILLHTYLRRSRSRFHNNGDEKWINFQEHSVGFVLNALTRNLAIRPFRHSAQSAWTHSPRAECFPVMDLHALPSWRSVESST